LDFIDLHDFSFVNLPFFFVFILRQIYKMIAKKYLNLGGLRWTQIYKRLLLNFQKRAGRF
jgi:hypothetical protein